MAIEITYTAARQGLARLLERVTDDREVVLIGRRGRPTAALVAADELESLLATTHPLRSPRNARRLLTALRRALERQGRKGSVPSLRRELGLEK